MLVTVVPESERELPAEATQTGGALLAVEMQGDLGVGRRPEDVATSGQLVAERLVAVELAVHGESEGRVGGRQGLLAGLEIDDAEPRVAEADPAIAGRPHAGAVGPAVAERAHAGPEGGRRDLASRGMQRYDPAHGVLPRRGGAL